MQMLPSNFHPPPSIGSEAFPPPDRIRKEVLLKLRWSILGALEDISIEVGLDENGTEQRQSFLSSPLAMESLADPPVSRLQLSSVDLYEAKHFHVLSEAYLDEPITITSADGRPITIKDFVTQVHGYLSQHKDALILCRKTAGFSNPPPPGEIVEPSTLCAYYAPGEHDLFFKSASGVDCPQGFVVDISTFMEGERGKSAETFWKSQRDMVDYAASCRASMPKTESST